MHYKGWSSPFQYRTWEIFGGEILANYAGRAVDKENFGKKATVSAYAIYIFCVSVNIGKENFGEWLMIHQIRQFSPTKISHAQYMYILIATRSIAT